MSSAAISRFEEIKDILIYTAVSDHAVTALELEEYVVDMTRGKMNYVLRALVADDYLISNQKGRSGARLYTATLKTKQLFGLDMKNNQIAVIETAQECKHCLNCSGWVPPLTDWDVMQSGYSDEQLYPQQFNLTIEQMRQILDNAPDGATGFINLEDDKYNCYVKFTSEWSKQNKHAYWGVSALTGEYRWSFMANAFGGHDLTCGLIELSELQKHVDQYVEPKRELEVLEMHDGPCTTIVVEG